MKKAKYIIAMVTLLSLSISQFAFAATSTTPIKNKSGSTVGTLTVTAGTVYKSGGSGGADIFDCTVDATTTVTCTKITIWGRSFNSTTGVQNTITETTSSNNAKSCTMIFPAMYSYYDSVKGTTTCNYSDGYYYQVSTTAKCDGGW